MLCPFCKEEIADGAVKCKHCKTVLEPNTVNQPQPSQIASQAAPPPPNDIDALSVSPGMKAKLAFVRDNLKEIRYGIPVYNGENNGAKHTMKMINIWALLFGGLYYFAKGIWKKGLILVGVGVALALVLEVMGINSSFAGIAPGVVAASCAYTDIYRKKVLNEDFWW